MVSVHCKGTETIKSTPTGTIHLTETIYIHETV